MTTSTTPAEAANAHRVVLYVLLVLVAGCAAVLSFSALRDLALLCGFADWTAPLLPLVVDAGAAAGTLAWLTREGRARGFGRLLALVLLGASVTGNAIGHALAAYGAAPHWALVVAVSAVAPAVLGACVHLAVLVGRGAAVATVDAESTVASETPTTSRETGPVGVSAPPEPQLEPTPRKSPKPRPSRVGPTPLHEAETPEQRRKRLARERQAARRARLAAEQVAA